MNDEPSSVSKVLAELPKLNKKELGAVKILLAQLMAPKGVDPKPLEKIVFDVLRVCLSLRISWEQFVETSSFKDWQKHITSVTDFITLDLEPKNKVEQIFTARKLIDLLVEDMKEIDVQVSIGAVCRNLGRIQDVFRNQFHGYIENKINPFKLGGKK